MDKAPVIQLCGLNCGSIVWTELCEAAVWTNAAVCVWTECDALCDQVPEAVGAVSFPKTQVSLAVEIDGGTVEG